MAVREIPKIIPPRSRVRLIKADERAAVWKKNVGRQFRVGFYDRSAGMKRIWLVNGDGQYERTTDLKFFLKHFDVEYLSREKDFFGRGRRRLRKIHVPSPLERLNGRSTVEAYEGAKALLEQDDRAMTPAIVKTLLHGRRAMNRAAAAYALNLMHGRGAVRALERAVCNKREHAKVRGQAAESLAHNHRPESHRVLRGNLADASRDVRFWCAYALAQMADCDALVPLGELAKRDHRVVRGFWSVSREAKATIRLIREAMKERARRGRLCLFCSMKRAKPDSGKSRR